MYVFIALDLLCDISFVRIKTQSHFELGRVSLPTLKYDGPELQWPHKIIKLLQ